MKRIVYDLDEIGRMAAEFVELQRDTPDSFYTSDQTLARQFLTAFLEHITPKPPKPKTPYAFTACCVYDATGTTVAQASTPEQAQQIADAINKEYGNDQPTPT